VECGHDLSAFTEGTTDPFDQGIEQAFDYSEQRQIGALFLPTGCGSPSAISGEDSLEQRFLALDVGLGPIAS
jgi:hypothetical protein